MKKSQKNLALNTQPQIFLKSRKMADKPSAKIIKSGKAHPKAAEKISNQPQKTTGSSKQAKIVTLLKRPDGATIEEMIKATDWQQHSIRGMMSGALKKRLGHTITSDLKERGRIYRITGSVSRS